MNVKKMSGLLFHNLRGKIGSFNSRANVTERIDVSKIMGLECDYRSFRIFDVDYPHQLYINYQGLRESSYGMFVEKYRYSESYIIYSRYRNESEMMQDKKDIEEKMESLEDIGKNIESIASIQKRVELLEKIIKEYMKK